MWHVACGMRCAGAFELGSVWSLVCAALEALVGHASLSQDAALVASWCVLYLPLLRVCRLERTLLTLPIALPSLRSLGCVVHWFFFLCMLRALLVHLVRARDPLCPWPLSNTPTLPLAPPLLPTSPVYLRCTRCLGGR
jgi:hypothetical protein